MWQQFLRPIYSPVEANLQPWKKQPLGELPPSKVKSNFKPKALPPEPGRFWACAEWRGARFFSSYVPGWSFYRAETERAQPGTGGTKGLCFPWSLFLDCCRM